MPVPNQADRKLIVCPICQKSFANARNKKAHVLVVHENAGPFKCGHCDKRFQDKSKLKRHEIIHTGEKPFKCKECSKRFKSKCILKRHEINVHAEKKFKCPHPQCEMAFGREPNLNRHLVTHSTEKPFQCDKCPKRFPSKYHLKEHLFCHAEKKLKCNPCGRSFAREAGLRKHLQRRKHRGNRQEVGEQPDESNARSKQTNCRPGPGLEESGESESDTGSGREEAEQPERNGERRKIKTENCLPDDEQVFELDDRMEGSLKRIKGEPEDAESSRLSDESDIGDSDGFEESDEETDREDEALEHDLDDRMEHDLGDLTEGCSKRIKIEPEEIELAPIEPTDFEAYDFMELAAANMKRMKMESQLVQDSSTVASANLKLVFDEDYRTLNENMM